MDQTAFPHFSSFVLAGFECTYARVDKDRRLDLLRATRHDELVEEDYQRLQEYSIRTVREGFAWDQIDIGGTYDFSRFESILKAGRKYNIQQIWDLNHFDYPDDVDPLKPVFIERFATYAAAVIKEIRKYQEGTIYVVPMNEISFFAWIGGDMGWWAPFTKGRKNGLQFKIQLVKAAISSMDAIWRIDPDVRFIQVDPFMQRLATKPASRSALKHVTEFNEVIRFEAWDMLSGKTYPEIGGDPKYLDIIGVNYYIHNQEWVISAKGKGKKLTHQLMDWESTDRVSFALMLQSIYQRYKRPMLISETGSFGEHREKWWDRTLKEVDQAMSMHLPVVGVCAYPVLDRPNSAGFLLPHSGLWDFEVEKETCERIPQSKVLALIRSYNQRWATVSEKQLIPDI